jgi:hypothetical protein
MFGLFKKPPDEQAVERIPQHELWPTLKEVYPHLTRGSMSKPGHVWWADSDFDMPLDMLDVKWMLSDDNTDRPPWLANSRDCDNFSERLWQAVREAREGLALQWPLFRAWVKRLRGKTTNHAVNLICVNWVWHWIEPQTDGIWKCDKGDHPYFIY